EGIVSVILQNAGSFVSVDAVQSSLSFRDDPDRGKGWWVFAADANGDGVDDLVQLNEFGEAWVALSNSDGTFDAPVRSTPLGYEHRPQGTWQVFVGNAF